MDADTPTHFNVLVVGTGLAESILAAALSKSGYSVLQLDPAPYYGAQHASLSLTELHNWTQEHSHLAESSAPPPEDLVRISQRFALSLFPALLRAQGPGIDLLVRSKVATYLQFGLLGGVGLWTNEDKGKGKVDRVPASKADVFNDQKLSLVEKRRLTKLLLFAAGQESLEEDKTIVADAQITFVDYLKKGYSLGGSVADSLAFALALCSSSTDPALPALQRLRSIIHSVGRYGPSPYLVGHYGGAGDLVGGFSRICAVWGGGQILGRSLLPLSLDPPAGTPVPPSQPPFMVHENPPPRPAAPDVITSDEQPSTTKPLGVPVRLDGDEAEPTMFTGDWIVSSPHLVSILSPSSTTATSSSQAEQGGDESISINLIAILSEAIPFPRPPTTDGSEEGASDLSDSNLFVFPPKALREEVETVTALQLGKGTMSCPDGYHVLYLSAPFSSSQRERSKPSTYLQPYLDALLALSTTPTLPLYTASYFITPEPTSSSPLPANFLITPSFPSQGQTQGLITALDEVVPIVEEMFWKIVGQEGRKEGVEFFRREESSGDGEEES